MEQYDNRADWNRRSERAGQFLWGSIAAFAMGLMVAVGSGIYAVPAARCEVGAVAAERINPNTAPTASLMRLPGIGKVRAMDILNSRKTSPFGSADDLERVRGIGPKTVEKIRPYLTFEREN